MKNMLLKPVKIRDEQLLDERKDPDFRFKRSMRAEEGTESPKRKKKKHMRFASNNLERIKEAIKVNELLESKPTELHNFKTPE